MARSELAEALYDACGANIIGQPEEYGEGNSILAVIIEHDGMLIPVAVDYRDFGKRQPQWTAADAILSAFGEKVAGKALEAQRVFDARQRQ